MIVGTTEAAKILNISTARLRVLLMAGRVEGAYKTGKMWLMPLFNGKPIIQRCKRGPAPRWRNPRKPAKTIVHVNTHKIRENQKQNKQQPVITVKKRCNPHEQTHFFSDSGLPTPKVDLPKKAGLKPRPSRTVNFMLSYLSLCNSDNHDRLRDEVARNRIPVQKAR